MKTVYMTALALCAVFAVPALAVTVDGCEVRPVEGGNYFVKVDPTCEFARVGLGEKGEGKLNPNNPAE